MCDPVSLAFGSLAIGAAGSVASYVAQNNAASQQAAYNAAASQAAQTQYIDSSKQEALRQQQEAEAASQKVFATNTELAQKLATARVAAGEAGVSGLSVDSLMGDIVRQASGVRQATERQLTLDTQQSEYRKKGYLAQRNNTIMGLPQPQYAGFGSLALNLAGNVANTAINSSKVDDKGNVKIAGISI
jgi:hypothetical protein